MLSVLLRWRVHYIALTCALFVGCRFVGSVRTTAVAYPAVSDVTWVSYHDDRIYASYDRIAVLARGSTTSERQIVIYEPDGSEINRVTTRWPYHGIAKAR